MKLENLEEYLKYASLPEKERDAADAYAGPGKSFPLYASGAHLTAAYDLAGHAEDPEAVRSKVIAFAKKHNLTHLLPDAAKHRMNNDMAQKALEWGVFEAMAWKAKNEDMQALMAQCFSDEMGEGDSYGQRRIIRFAEDRGITHLLPDTAHGMMHDMGVQHSHDGISNDENGHHTHTLAKHEPEMATKAAIEAAGGLVAKAWEADGATFSEGWLSTPDMDLQKEIYQPEAFSGAIADYMACGGPHSCEHDTSGYPVGHVQHIAVVRDGQILKEATHPDDAADFEYFPGSGSGLYGRVRYTDDKVGFSVKAGNIRSYSWIGKPTKREPLPGGGAQITEVYPLLETTSAAYPVNQRAAMLAAKAR